jgi:class 3 adenylate cyclase/CHASE2 domain-containing sensor protein
MTSYRMAAINGMLLMLVFGTLFAISRWQDKLNAPLLWAAVEPHQADGVVLVIDDTQSRDHQELVIAPDSRYIPRDIFADAIRNLKEAGARVIVPDIYFGDLVARNDIPSNKRRDLPEHNRRLKQAIASAHPKIVLTLNSVSRLENKELGAGNRLMLENWEGILPRLSGGETIPQGHPNFSRHPESKITYSVPLVVYGMNEAGKNLPYYALSVWAVAKAVGIAPETFVNRLESQLPAGIFYPDYEPNLRLQWETDDRRDGESLFPQISLKEAAFCEAPGAGFMGTNGRKVDVRNQIVLIGRRDETILKTYRQAMQSSQLSPEQKAKLMPVDWVLRPDGQWVPGVVAHAYAITTMLHLGPVKPANPWIYHLLLGMTALGMLRTARCYSLSRSLPTLLLTLALGLFAGFLLIRTQGIYIPVSNMVTGLGIAFLAGILWRANSGPPPVVRPGLNSYVVLFADINRSTELGKLLGPERMLSAKNALWRKVDQVIKKYKGAVSDYTGDGFIALFPLTSRAATNAIRAALELLAEQHEAPDRTELALKIGITHGEIVFDEMGGTSKRDYTATGFPLDLASRLCNLAPQLGMCLLIEEPTYWRADVAQADLVDCGVHVVKGSEPIHLYGLPLPA